MNNGRKKNEWEQNWKHWKQNSFVLKLENWILNKFHFFVRVKKSEEKNEIDKEIFLGNCYFRETYFI